MAKPTQHQLNAVLNVSDWPARLSLESDDILVGKAVIERIEPFLRHLVDRGLAVTTLRRHHNNMLQLTHEVVRHFNQTGDYSNLNVDEVLDGLLSDREGPELRGSDEAQQRAFNATCGMFCRFLSAKK